MSTTEKPLFIPLKSEYFKQFSELAKSAEYRVYGKRWNERTCRVGRRVVLSKGYGKRHRLEGIVTGFEKRPAELLADREAFEDCYGTTSVDAAILYISVSDLSLWRYKRGL